MGWRYTTSYSKLTPSNYVICILKARGRSHTAEVMQSTIRKDIRGHFKVADQRTRWSATLSRPFCIFMCMTSRWAGSYPARIPNKFILLDVDYLWDVYQTGISYSVCTYNSNLSMIQIVKVVNIIEGKQSMLSSWQECRDCGARIRYLLSCSSAIPLSVSESTS